MSASNWTKALPRRKKLERAQPIARSHRGLLEKKKDYKRRNAIQKEKESFFKDLASQAQNKNPDEFNFKMVTALKPIKDADIKIIKKVNQADKNYVGIYAATERKRLEKLQAHLQLTGEAEPQHQHTIFVSDEEDVQNFDKVEYFDTIPEAVNRIYSRPTKKQLLEDDLLVNKCVPDWKEIQEEREKNLEEFQKLKQRVDVINDLQQKVEAQSRKLQRRKKGVRQK